MVEASSRLNPLKRKGRGFLSLFGMLLFGSVLMNQAAFGQTLLDSFGDGDFTASPVWAGSTAQYGIQANSDAAAGATASNTIRLAATAPAATKYLSSQVATWEDEQTWRFFIGRRAQAFTGSNEAYFYLYANESNLTSATVDGYRIAIGDDAGGDDIRLEYIVNNAISATVIATSTSPIANGLTDIGLMVRVTRTNAGLWSIFTSTVPTANGTGAIATGVPTDLNTAVSQGSATNNTLIPAANGYIGIANEHTTGANALISTEWDQIYFNTAPASVTPTVNSSTTSLPKFFANTTFASSGQQFDVSGVNLGTNNLTVGPLAGYEFATTSTFTTPLSSLTFTPSSGTVAATTVYARLLSTNAVGSYNGNIPVAAVTATTVNVAVTGQVYGNGTGNFTAGNLLTLRVGETAGPALSSAGAPIFLDEYTPAGLFVQSKPVPFTLNALGTNNRRLTMSGTSTSEGYLNLSPDGQYLTFAGYDANVGTAAVTGTSAATNNRIVARVEQDGTINTTTRISDGYETNNIRSAATVDGNAFWTGGAGASSTGGARYMVLGNTGTSTQVSTTITNSRGTAIYNSQLYNTSQSGSNISVNTVGTGLPTNIGNTTSVLAGTATNVDLTNPHGFVFVDQDDNGTPDVMYVADANLGLVKFSNTSGTWTKRGSLPNPAGRSAYGITATAVGANRRIYLSLGTTSTISTEIYTFLDNSAITSDITSNGIDIITACGAALITSPNAANVGFKGVTFAPVDVPTPTVDHTFTSAGTNIAQGTTNAPLYRIQCDVTVGNALLTGVTVTTAGAYAGSDFNNFRLILSTDATLDGGDVVLSTISSSTGPGQVLAFTGLGQNLPASATRYLFIAGSVSGCATVGSSINITSTALSAITYADVATVKTGTPVAGTSKNIILGVLDEVTGLTAQSGQPTVQVGWTNPGCVTEIIVVAHTSPILGTPTGTYTGNLDYNLAPAFPGGGRVVYNGTTSPQIISGLTVNTLYYFKVFVRFSSNYSAGVQVTATPTLVNLYSRGSGLSHTDAIWSTSPTGTPQTLAAAGGLALSRGIIIQNGHSVQLSQSGGTVLCRELIINSGGTLTATGTLPGDVKYLLLHGNVTNNGTIGTGTTFNPISFGPEGTSVTLQGNGVYNLARINKRTVVNATTNLIINANVNLRFAAGAALHNNIDNTRLNTVVSTGKTLTITEVDGDLGLDGTDGLSGGDRSGNLIVNGTLNVGGTLFARNNNTVPGSTCAVTVSGSGIINANNIFTDLALTPGQGTTFNISAGGKVNVTGTLTVNSGTFSSNGGLVLKSSAAGTARIANSAGAISGNITAERYIATAGWHLTGTAIGGQTLTDWNDDFQTQGPFPGATVFNGGYLTSNIYGFDQADNSIIPYGTGATTNGWVIPGTSALTQNTGYRIFTPAGVTLDNTGTYSTGLKTLTTFATGSTAYYGYNLFVNPHLSAVNRAGFTLAGGIQNTILVWDPSSNAYRYDGTAMIGSIPGGPSPIASGQGFFVYSVSNGATITIPEAAKALTSGTFYRTNTAQNAMEIQLKNSAGQSDVSLFQFHNDAEAGYDTKYDAHKLLNPGISVYTLTSENGKLANQALPFVGDQMVMPIGFKAEQGAFTFNFTGVDVLNDASNVFLKDNETGEIVDLQANPVYAFVNNSASENNTRFELIFTNAVTSVKSVSTSSTFTVYPNPVSADHFTVAAANLSGKVTVEVLDMLGRRVENKVFENFGKTTEVQIAKPTVAGQYSVKVTDAKGSAVKSLMVK